MSHILAPRWVWDPTVHKAFGEDCSYFLLRLYELTKTLIPDMETLIAEARLTATGVYKLFGYYDVLLRVWATAHQREQLIEALANDRSVEFVDEFRVRKAYYEWSEHSHAVDIRYLNKYRREIELVAAIPASDPADVEPALATLREARLVHYIDPRSAMGGSSEEPVKFYIALAPTQWQVRSDDSLVRLAVQGMSEVQLASTYCGSGFANFLIKGVVAHYSDVETCYQQLSEQLAQRGLNHLRPMTLLIANADATESDRIDTQYDEMSRELLQLQRLLPPKAGRYLGESDRLTQDEIRNVYTSYYADLLDTPFERFFLGLIEARLLKDSYMLGEKLSFIMHLEALVSHYLSQEWRRKLGAEWHEIVSGIGSELRRSGRRTEVSAVRISVRDFTLSDYIRVNGRLRSTGKLDLDEVDEALGHGWEENLRDLLPLRNDVAHGRVFASDSGTAMAETWRDIAAMACGVGGIYNALVNFVERSDANAYDEDGQ